VIEKIKKKSKDFMKKASCIILTFLLLLSSCITTTFALDGEVGGIPKDFLTEYIKSVDVLYNPNDYKVYSCFNHEALYWLIKWPVPASEDWTVSESEYLSVMTEDSTGVRTLYFLIPERNDSYFANLSSAIVFKGGINFPDVYVSIFKGAREGVVSGSDNVSCLNVSSLSFSDVFRGLLNDTAHTEAINGYVYSAQISKESTLLNVSEIFMGQYAACLDYFQLDNVVQVSYHSYDTLKTSLPSYFTHTSSVSTINLNSFLSTSTYSITAVDYFDSTDNLMNFYSDIEVPFIYRSHSSFSKKSFVVPQEIRGPTCPSDGQVMFVDGKEYPYYLSDGIFDSERAFLIMPYINSTSSSLELFIFVFPESVQPLLYFKVLSGYGEAYPRSGYSSRCLMYIQVLSKVDYDVYARNGTKIGSFDADTTTYTCIDAQYTGTSQYFNNFIYSEIDATSSDPKTAGTLIPIGSSLKCYPYFLLCADADGYYFNLNKIYGNRCSFSIFRPNSLGFYVYVSPDLMPSLEDGSLGGGFIDGGTHTPGSKSEDWDFEPDWDSVYSGMLQLELPDYPDTEAIFDIEIADIWELPERIVQYIVLVVQWFADAFEVFISTYAQPVSKVFHLMGMVFEKIPPFFRFIFIYTIVIILAMKILQYSTCSVGIVGSIRTNRDSSRVIKQSAEDKSVEKQETSKGGDKS